jgi:hypothetical protein
MIRYRREDDVVPNFYYHVIPYRVEEMSSNELIEEIECLENWFSECAKIGQGISTKEGVRYRNCKSAYIKMTFGENAEERLRSFFGVS